MAFHTRRVITPVEDIIPTTSSSAVRRKINTVSSKSPPKPLQVSFASASDRRLSHRAGGAGKAASIPVKGQAYTTAKSLSPPQNHLSAPNYTDKAISRHDHETRSPVMKPFSNEDDRIYENAHSEHVVVAEKGDLVSSPAAGIPDGGVSPRRGSGNTDDEQSESDHDQDVGTDSGEERVGRLRQRKPNHNQQEWQSMATFAKAQGVDLMKQVEEQKSRKLENDQESLDIAKAEMEEMKRILQERRGSSEDYLIPSETERDSSPERNGGRKSDVSVDQSTQRYSAEWQIDAMKNEDPSEVLNWLKSTDEEIDKRIAVSEDRTLSLLQAIKAGNVGVMKGSLPGLEEDWVLMKRLREAERKSSVAEEQIRQIEELLNAAEGVHGDEQLRALLSRSKSMERHFHHLKKFVEDRHCDLKKLHSSSEKDPMKSWRRPQSGASPEKVRQDMLEHENHKKRLMQVFSLYNDLLKFLRVERTKRVEAESKSQQLTSQVKRQTAALKRAEKTIRLMALPPRVEEDSHPEVRSPMDFPSTIASGTDSPTMASNFTQRSPFTFTGLQPRIPTPGSHNGGDRMESTSLDQGMPTLRRINTVAANNPRAAMHSPAMITVSKQLSYDHALEQSLSRNSSPDPGGVLSNSDLIAENHKKEFEELERALIEEGRSRGFADVDLYSEKKTVGREDTCWEYKHMHFDFNRVQQGGSPSASREKKWDTLDLHSVSNLPISKRTASPSRSEGSAFESKHDHVLSSSGPHKPTVLAPGISHDPKGVFNLRGQSLHPQKQKPQQSVGPPMIDRKPLVRLHHPVDKGNESPKTQGITQSTSSKQPDKEMESTQQIKFYRRVQSSPAKIMSSLVSNGRLLYRKIGEPEARPFGVDDSREEEDPWQDVSEDALDGMLIDVVKDEVWSDASAKNADWADMSESLLNDVAQSEGIMSDDMALISGHAHGGYMPSDERRHGHISSRDKSHMEDDGSNSRHIPHGHPSDLGKHMAIMESSHAAHSLQAQVRQRRWLLLFQTALLMAALLWSATWWRSVPPPT